MMKNKKKTIFLIVIATIITSIIIYACYKLIPLLMSLNSDENKEVFKAKIQDLGYKDL